ncbi:acyl-CoA synthetase, partial [Streptomyces beijiangensis]|nr:acyl-CoA synthetase [Streptomyces beijiangensis]
MESMGSAGTVAELVERQWGDDRVGLRADSLTLSHHEVAAGAAARAALLVDLLPRGAQPQGKFGGVVEQHPEMRLSAARQ